MKDSGKGLNLDNNMVVLWGNWWAALKETVGKVELLVLMMEVNLAGKLAIWKDAYCWAALMAGKLVVCEVVEKVA